MKRTINIILIVLAVGFMAYGFVVRSASGPVHDTNIQIKVGEKAPDLSFTDPSGKTITLSSLEGKIVLLDFWASWCGPCRKENPAMIGLYKEMKMQKIPFEIIGVAADFVENRWKKAITKDQLPWINVSDVKGFDGKALKLYGIKSIPYTVLLDMEGIIVEKGLTGEELRTKLREIFKI